MNKFTMFALAVLFSGTAAFAQVKKDTIPYNWHQLDPATSGYNGISLQKAYDLIKAKKLKSKRVTVAVIDSGIDTLHEDLKSLLWTNAGEIPGNGIDDDHNGYIDDVHGWNFIGGKDGKNVDKDSYEATRVYYTLKPKWDGKAETDAVTPVDKKEFADYTRAKAKSVGDVDTAQTAYLTGLMKNLVMGDSIIIKETGKAEYTVKDLVAYTPTDKAAQATKGVLTSISKANNSEDITNKQLIESLDGEIRKGQGSTEAPEKYRAEIVKDDESNVNDRNYGNNDLMAGTPFHGTHCSGIIAAVRNNGVGVDGIADNVRIMMVRAVPDGDEHDKDIANAIRYAVDNGAQIISMSFGKDFSPEKQWVDDAFRYAASKNVLLVQAAGNSGENIDSSFNFPSAYYLDGSGRANNILTVGASGDMKNGGLTASFSNYGKERVDVFAPGVKIYSSVPGGNKYGNASGTSMACPVVAGTAALLLEYFPNLTAVQLKMIIEKSAQAPAGMVNKPGTKDKVSLSDISKTGGIINAYEAVKYASTVKTMPAKMNLPKSKMKPVKKA